MSKPFSWGMPADKVCEKLKKKDKQICELRYEKQIDLKTVDLKKLKVRDLKKILGDWDEGCDGCLEKGDFIKRIEELKPKYMREELQKNFAFAQKTSDTFFYHQTVILSEKNSE